MNFLSENSVEKGGINKGFLIGGVIGVLVIAALIVIGIVFWPPKQDQMDAVLADALREGSPEFQSITKDIIIATGENTGQSPNAFGRISMFISGNIRNKGNRVINGLEVNVAVVDINNNVVKEKRVLVVPTQIPQLGPSESIPITLSLDGFDPKDDRANIRWKVTAIRVK